MEAKVIIMRKKRSLFSLITLFFLSFSFPVAVQAAEETPKEVVTRTANELLGIIEEARGYYDEDPQRFYDNVEGILEPAVDMRRFAAGVMAKYYRVATNDQRR
ncbi:ABC transporter substrate-binding protein, partial [Oceanospirillum sp. HFRX-1_2]